MAVGGKDVRTIGLTMAGDCMEIISISFQQVVRCLATDDCCYIHWQRIDIAYDH